jgi:hypothetical protein
MVTSLRGRLSDLATEFVSTVLNVVRHASVEEVLGEGHAVQRPVRAATPRSAASSPATAPRNRSARLARRSAGDIADVIERIVELVEAHPEGLRAEQIREELALEAKELPRPLSDAIAAGRLRKAGRKRATTYFVKVAPAARSRAPRKASKPKRSAASRAKRVRHGATEAVEASVPAENGAASGTNANANLRKPRADATEKAEKTEAPPADGTAPAVD